VLCGSHRDFLWCTAEHSERSQQRAVCSAAPSHNSRLDPSLVARRRQERRRARLSLASLSNNSSSSLRRVDLCSAALRRSSHRRLGTPSSLHSPPVDCLEARRPNSSPLKVDLYSGAAQLNRLRAADSLAHNSPLNNNNNNRGDRFLAARNNQSSSREPLSLETPNNPLLDRRHRSLVLHNNRPPPGLHCLVAPSNHRQDRHRSEIPSPHYSVPPPRRSLSSNHPL
jgi:hypothetical protein